MFGYVLYDIVHYMMHHYKMKSDYFKDMKAYHILHHYREPTKGYGITSKLWDCILDTKLNQAE